MTPPAVSRDPVSAAGAFVGRARELAVLDDVLTGAASGRGVTVLVTGPAGVGKSALLGRFVHRHRDDGIVLTAACHSGHHEPFGPWTDVLTQAVRALGDGTDTNVTARVDDPRHLVDRLLTVWARADRPVIVVIDDWHWADMASRQMLDLIRSSLLNEPVMLVLSSRPAGPGQAAPPTRSLLPLVEITVDGLSAAEVAAWLAVRYGLDATDDATDAIDAAADRLSAECGGNPLAITARLIATERGTSPPETSTPGTSTPGTTSRDESSDPPRTAAAATGDSPLEILRRLVDAPATVQTTSLRRWIDGLIDRLSPAAQRALAIVEVAASLTRSQACAATGITLDELEQARREAADLGLIPDTWAIAADVHPLIVDCLVERLSQADSDAAHLAIGRFILERVPDRIIDAAHHLLEAVAVVPRHELVDVLDRAGLWAHHHFAHAEAAALLTHADDLAPDDTGRLERTRLRADVERVRGDLHAASQLSLTAARLARATGDADAFAASASGYSSPMEWRSGDPVALELLEQALAAGPSLPWRATLTAKIAEHRVRRPHASADGRQWAWSVDSPVNQDLVAQAVALARRSDDPLALMTTLSSWRALHRSPALLAERRAISAEMLRLAEQLRRPVDAVHAAVRVAVDELEAANRDGFEQATVLTRWIADQESSPYLLWRAHCLEATRALLDADLDAFRRSRRAAEAAGRASDAPGHHVSEMVHLFHELDLAGDLVTLESAGDPSAPALAHPLGVASWAWVLARVGRTAMARRLLARLTWPADSESSMLLVSELALRAAVLCDDHITLAAAVPTVERFADHVAVDSEALWPGEPVAVGLAEAYRTLGRTDDAVEAVDLARRVNATLGDVRTAGWLAGDSTRPHREIHLSEREAVVLRLMAEGHGNAAIATMLHYSVATIRRETTSIYQRLGVSNRAGAVARAHELGLLR